MSDHPRVFSLHFVTIILSDKDEPPILWQIQEKQENLVGEYSKGFTHIKMYS